MTGALGSDLAAPLRDLAGFLGSQVAIAPEYRRLVDFFVRRFGEGGACDDVPSFVMSVGSRLMDIPELGAKVASAPPQPAAPGSAVGVTVHAQIARRPGAPTALVVNRVYERVGWLASRYCGLDAPEYRAVRAQLAAWLDEVNAPCEPVDLALNGACNDLQAHPRLTRRVLAWSGEEMLPSRGGVLHAADLRLRHDLVDGVIRAFDPAGAPLALVYLGSALPTFQWGSLYALALLTQPYVLARPPVAPDGIDAVEESDLVAEPRLTVGQAICRRAAWYVRASYLRERWFAQPGARGMLAVRRELERHGIPDVFFANRRLDVVKGSAFVTQDSFHADRKPAWIDTSNAFSLQLLEQLATRNEWLTLTEMLPAREDLWTTWGGRQHVSEIHAELVVRAQ